MAEPPAKRVASEGEVVRVATGLRQKPGSWQGGHVSGYLGNVSACRPNLTKPFVVQIRGEKCEYFTTMTEAEARRRKVSDGKGLTKNRWRKLDSGSIEMQLQHPGVTTTFDEEDLDKIKEHVWCLDKSDGRVRCNSINNPFRFLPVFVMQDTRPEGDGWTVDHIDRNTVNNNRTNLRWATVSQNGRNCNLSCDNSSGQTNIGDSGTFIFTYRGRQKPQKQASFTVSLEGSRERAWAKINLKRVAAIAASEDVGEVLTYTQFRVKVCDESWKTFSYKDGDSEDRQRALSEAITERDAAQLRQGSTNGKRPIVND